MSSLLCTRRSFSAMVGGYVANFWPHPLHSQQVSAARRGLGVAPPLAGALQTLTVDVRGVPILREVGWRFL